MNKDIYPKGIVPLEIAKKMKELGFNEPCVFFYRERGENGHVCLNSDDTQIRGYADYSKVCFVQYYIDIEKYNSNQHKEYVSLPDFETAEEWFRSFDFIEDFFIRKIEEYSKDRYEFLINVKSSIGEHFYNKKVFKGLENTREKLMSELCDTVYYYTKVLNVDKDGKQ